jgi:aspartyl-tRNA(Asn)/glutamyl-tRNA(Gln) amidotransferase subunit A
MSEPLHRKTIAELATLIAAREVSPLELVEHFLRRIEAHNPRLNAFVHVCGDAARDSARRLTEELAHGAPRSPLYGIPVAVKDLTDTAGIPTTYGSSLFRGHVPHADAQPVALLRAAGAVLVGKTNTHEFAFGTTTNNPHYGATHNPWRLGHVPGGSSGGSGAAVGGGLVPLATGTDTGGSIRIPAAACGCVGIKPSFGRVSLRGTYPLASSLDHVGPLARTAADCAIALRVMAGFDRDDPWSCELPPLNSSLDQLRPLAGVRVGVAPAYRPLPVAPAVLAGLAAARDTLAELGAEIVEVALPDAQDLTLAASVVLLAESYAHHQAQFTAHRTAYGDDVREQLDASAAVDTSSLVRALHARERLTRAVADVLATQAPILLLPTMAVTAPPIGAPTVVVDGVSLPVAPAMASFTLLQNFTRMPTVAVPSGLDADGLPTSFQLTAALGQDANVLAVAQALDSALWPHQRRWPAGAGDDA